VKGNLRDPNLIRHSRAGAPPGPDAEALDAEERRQAASDQAVSQSEARQSIGIMGWLFGGAEFTPLFVVTFLTLACPGLWVSLAIWGPDTPRVNTLIDTLGKAFTFFVGLFSGSLIGRRR